MTGDDIIVEEKKYKERIFCIIKLFRPSNDLFTTLIEDKLSSRKKKK